MMWNILWIVSLIAATLWGISSEVSPPVKMMIVSVWIFLTAKLQSFPFRTFRSKTDRAAAAIKWCLLTPTLDYRRFQQAQLGTQQRPGGFIWGRTVFNIPAGLFMLFFVAPWFLPLSSVWAGWAAMTGIALWLHFGLLGLIVLFWRFRGCDTQLLMNAPVLSTSLSEFWGRRWNTAFRDFAHQQIFRPVCRRWNPHGATLLSFVFSGLIHELAISVPAGAGYGLPTIYFLLQYAGVILERKAVMRGWPLGLGIPGWLFTAAFVLLPAGLLFHSAFVLNVIVPLIPNVFF